MQAGRYYSKPSLQTTLPNPTFEITSPTSDDVPLSDEHERRRSSLAEREGTPFRELTEDEAQELQDIEETAVRAGGSDDLGHTALIHNKL